MRIVFDASSSLHPADPSVSWSFLSLAPSQKLGETQNCFSRCLYLQADDTGRCLVVEISPSRSELWSCAQGLV